ncbi:MAG: hypothetical protein Q8M01_17600 [Rubrivivax sp.]|nr:hypothetical protein [Rubrivivax sp.]
MTRTGVGTKDAAMTAKPTGCAWTTGDAVAPQSLPQDEHVGMSAECSLPGSKPASKQVSVLVAPGLSAPWPSQQGAASIVSASVDELPQQVRAGPASAAAIQIWISSANTRTIVGKRIDRTHGFNNKPRAGGLCEVKRQRETVVLLAWLQPSLAAKRPFLRLG